MPNRNLYILGGMCEPTNRFGIRFTKFDLEFQPFKTICEFGIRMLQIWNLLYNVISLVERNYRIEVCVRCVGRFKLFRGINTYHLWFIWKDDGDFAIGLEITGYSYWSAGNNGVADYFHLIGRLRLGLGVTIISYVEIIPRTVLKREKKNNQRMFMFIPDALFIIFFCAGCRISLDTFDITRDKSTYLRINAT